MLEVVSHIGRKSQIGDNSDIYPNESEVKPMDNEKLLQKLTQAVIDLNQRVEALEKKAASVVTVDVSELAQAIREELEKGVNHDGE